MEKLSSQRAAALLMVTATLMLLSAMAIGFVRMATLEKSGSGNYLESINARFLVHAGMEYAAARLQNDFGGELVDVNRDWLCWAADNPPLGALYIEDDNGAGVNIRDLRACNPAWPTRPSYVYRQGTQDYCQYPGGFQRRCSGYVQDLQKIYSLKILDTASQINLNSHCDPNNPYNASVADSERLAKLLLNLSQAITLRTGYTPPIAAPAATLEEVCRNIFSKRNEWQGFKSKRDISRVPGVTPELMEHLWDYYTVYPSLSQIQSSLYTGVKRVIPGDETKYTMEYRSPIHINTAPWPVLVALFADLERQDATAADPAATSVAITPSEAIALANKICEQRRCQHFAGTDDFFAFLDAQKTAVFSSNTDTKAAIVKANCGAGVYLRHLNPDAVVYQSINKLDLSYYTTEFCYFPYGMFEIHSLGEIVDDQGQTLSSAKYYGIVEVFNLLRYRTQNDFEEAARNPSPQGRGLTVSNLQDNHCATHPENVQNDALGTAPEMDYFGYVEPVAYDDPVLFGQSDIHSNLKCKAVFNGNLNLRNFAGTTLDQASPYDSRISQFHDAQLVPDGVRWLPNTTFCHVATGPNENFECYDANTPPREGVLMFWIKFNQMDASKWYTVYLSTSSVVDFSTDGMRFMHPDDPNAEDPRTWVANTTAGNVTIVQLPQNITNGLDLSNANINSDYTVAPFEPGIQFPDDTRWAAALQMHVAVLYDEVAKKLVVSAKRHFLKWPCGYDDKIEIVLSPAGSNSIVKSQASLWLEPSGTKGFPVRPHEWYHLAIRWRNFAEIGRASGQPDIVVSGEFYNDSGQILHRGPVLTRKPGYRYYVPAPETKEYMPILERAVNYRQNKQKNIKTYADFVAGFGLPDPPDPLDATKPIDFDVPLRYQPGVAAIRANLEKVTFADGQYNTVRAKECLARSLFRAAAYMSTDLRKAVLPLAFREVRPLWYKRLYWGTEFATDTTTPLTPLATLDDFGIYGAPGSSSGNQIEATANVNSLFNANYQPGRYVVPANPDNLQVATYQGRFVLPVTKAARLGSIYWNVRHVPGIFCDTQDKAGWPENYPHHVWDEIWQRLTQGATKPRELTAVYLNYDASGTVGVVNHVKNGVIRIKLAGVDVATVNIVNQYSPEADYTWASTDTKLKTLLLNWYSDYAVRHGLSDDPLELCYTIAQRRDNGHPLANSYGERETRSPGDIYNCSYDGDVRFLANDTLPAIFRMAVLEELFLSYQDEIHWQEYGLDTTGE